MATSNIRTSIEYYHQLFLHVSTTPTSTMTEHVPYGLCIFKLELDHGNDCQAMHHAVLDSVSTTYNMAPPDHQHTSYSLHYGSIRSTSHTHTHSIDNGQGSQDLRYKL